MCVFISGVVLSYLVVFSMRVPLFRNVCFEILLSTAVHFSFAADALPDPSLSAHCSTKQFLTYNPSRPWSTHTHTRLFNHVYKPRHSAAARS